MNEMDGVISGLTGTESLLNANRYGVAVELVSVGASGSEFETILEFSDFEGFLDGWISHNELS